MDPYPFQGAVRWGVLPALIVAAGAAVAFVENLFSPARLGPWVSLAVGAAMAAGRRPAVAVLAAFLLGGLSLFAGQAVITQLLRLRDAAVPRPGRRDPRRGTERAADVGLIQRQRPPDGNRILKSPGPTGSG